jgi:hypothetical protein
LDKRPRIFIRDKTILSSERMLHKDYDCMGSVAKKKTSACESQEELIGGKPPVAK